MQSPYSHGPQIASVLHQFHGRFDHNIIGSGTPYSRMRNAWTKYSVTHHLFSGGLFRVIHDAAGFSRTQKVAEIVKVESISHNVKFF